MIDRVIRVLIGVLLLALTVVGPKTMWGIVGLVPFVYVVESLRRELRDPTPLRADVTARLRERLAKSIDDDQRSGSRT